ncbi:hypothetical protein BOTBODRAFT_191846 [Botryobasidium botryosum FD-172 SS1]|uniref:Multicopper oxidase n=1 Tax=Botryobasidium botryosum (strain FD-172 SS1) TaxID=930990 RepID=A0A067LYP6_BOTB1|nr:hypothetical protein BOTBODRAFT_191846 [Botryobasidium botryosum FD-172 SS1]
MRLSLVALFTGTLANIVFALPGAVQVARDQGPSTRKYDLELTTGYAASDGITRPVYFVNGITPGPQITAKKGDDLEITVTNKLPVNVTIHWHGIDQVNTDWSDGVPGVTQGMIVPGEVFIYRWTATQSGLYWYHAHSRDIYDDGVRGVIYLEPADDEDTPFDLISSDPDDVSAMVAANKNPSIVALGDRKHFDSERDLAEWNRTHIEQLCVDSLLVNGKGRVICPTPQALAPYIAPPVTNLTARGCIPPDSPILTSGFNDTKPQLVSPDVFYNCDNTTAPFSVVSVDPTGKWAALGFVNTAGLWQIKVSVDGHKLYVYAADGQYHHPQIVDVVTIPIGERYQVMIKLDQPAADYTIRIAADGLPQYISGYAVLSYTKSCDDVVTSLPPDVNPAMAYGGLILNNATTLNPLSLQPYPASLAPPQEATHTFFLDINRTSSLTWALDKTSYLPFHELQSPVLFAPQDAAAELDPTLLFSYPLGSVIDLVLQSAVGDPPHPVHKHKHNAWIIGYGTVPFTWDSVASAIKEQPSLFNLVNPPLRDGFNTPPATTSAAFLVIRLVVTEASVTYMHCHINTHQMGGMAVVLLEGADQLAPIPPYYLNGGK